MENQYEVNLQSILKDVSKKGWLINLYMLVFQYFSTIYLTLLNPYSSAYIQMIKILWIPLQIIYIMVVWSLFKCFVSDPGRVPKHWQMFFGQQGRNRYCLLCHNYKPDRCYHCFECNRCVLNMDHHSFWIKNCVGYYNSKFYLLFWFYINLSATLSLIVVSLQIYPKIMNLFYRDDKQEIQNQSILPTILLLLYLFVIAVLTLKSLIVRIKLAITNQTIISQLNQRGQQDGQRFQYDIRYKFNQSFIVKENWFQVMGTNPWLWPFPIYGQSGRPKGDGINWQRNQN
ncbi:unnamed protein product [Paramecium primaurelia]|uniref:Palmitoyltransferase n=1 Tax=Paramecium primaurelia TaxID=5886 RepID=A0A8S1KX40_PARPR|nr:unnamed protein product [Paramecium primaurelia]